MKTKVKATSESMNLYKKSSFLILFYDSIEEYKAIIFSLFVLKIFRFLLVADV